MLRIARHGDKCTSTFMTRQFHVQIFARNEVRPTGAFQLPGVQHARKVTLEGVIKNGNAAAFSVTCCDWTLAGDEAECLETS
jgi:hypothetical protein